MEHGTVSAVGRRIRSKVWSLHLNEKVENTIQKCFACQTTLTCGARAGRAIKYVTNAPASTETPQYGLLWSPTGEYLSVLIDKLFQIPSSRSSKVSANTTVPILDKVLSNFGIQEVIKKQIMEVNLIHRHSKSLPLTAALPTVE